MKSHSASCNVERRYTRYNTRGKRKARLHKGDTISDYAKAPSMDKVLHFELRSPVSLKGLFAKSILILISRIFFNGC